MKIDVSKSDFTEAPQQERDWMLYEAVSLIHSQGCSFAREKCAADRWKKLYVIGAAIGSAVAFSIGVLKFLHLC